MNPQPIQPTQPNPLLVPQVPPAGNSFNVVNTTNQNNNKRSKALLAILVLMVGVAGGLFAVLRPVIFKSSAWNCNAYVFALSDQGVVTVKNGQTNGEPPQKAQIYINNNLVATYDVPGLAAGEQKTIGTVTVPQGTFTWQIQGTTDCSDAGRVDVQVMYQCKMIKTYDAAGTELTAAALSTLTAGDTVRFAAVGSANASYTAARFSINSGIWIESTTKIVATGDFYTDYIIPAGVTSFDVAAQVKGTNGVWY